MQLKLFLSINIQMRFVVQSEDTQSKQNRCGLLSQANLSPLETRTIPEGDNVTNPYCDFNSLDYLTGSMISVKTRRNQKLVGKLKIHRKIGERSNLQDSYDESEYSRA